MAEETSQQPSLTPVAQSLSLIPVGLKEAALDSPTFRATSLHFGEQLELLEGWLHNFVKQASKLASEASTLDTLINGYVSAASPPQYTSEAVLDHDYTLLALSIYGSGTREFWNLTIRGMRRVESQIVEPIRNFLNNDLRNLREARRILDQHQRFYDGVTARFASQSKTKEASSIREDAFQLYEARKLYLKSSMDFCLLAPQVRAALDKILVKSLADHWRELKSSRDSSSAVFGKWSSEMERVKGWSKEMENGERAFIKELTIARKQIEDNADLAVKPSRELDEYNSSTVPYIGAQGASGLRSPAKPPVTEKNEKQGWLYQRVFTGKPQRAVWIRKWFFVKNGIFGWLVQGLRSGAVEESEKIGVLLCGVRPAFQEERRFCFEIKTKDSTLLLQAETQQELVEWIAVFEVVKRRALEHPGSLGPPSGLGSSGTDAAFAISPPVAPEFAAKSGEGHATIGSDEVGIERAATLGIMPSEGIATRGSFDVTRRSVGDREGEGSSSRDHAARIIQKLDLHRRGNQGNSSPAMPSPASAGGIASLISASHNVLPAVAAGGIKSGLQLDANASTLIRASTLAPSTLANPPAMTNLSKAAVIVNSERGFGLGQSGGIPGGLMANLWGSTNWGHVNRLERDELKTGQNDSTLSPPASPAVIPARTIDSTENGSPAHTGPNLPGGAPSPSFGPSHRKTLSAPTDALTHVKQNSIAEAYPSYYPPPLKVQDAQFRVLFPSVPLDEHVVLVFRATWNPNEQQEFPGRVYVTSKEIYFYSHHIGLVLITGVNLTTIAEITAAPGRDCDFIFIHFKDDARVDGATRLTIKTFLEPLKLLQRRLSYLVKNGNSETPDDLENILKRLIKYESDNKENSPSNDSWEEINADTPVDGLYESTGQDVRGRLRIDNKLYRQATGLADQNITKFKLPAHPVVYVPADMFDPVIEKDYDVSAKALFHIMFGDKSAVFQTLYGGKWAKDLVQMPWSQPQPEKYEREFHFKVAGGQEIVDKQNVDIFNDHLCYVITDKKTPWYLPQSSSFNLTTKLVITHVSKNRSKLAIYAILERSKHVFFGSLIERQARQDLKFSVQDLTDVVTDQVRRLGTGNGTRKALRIFGALAQGEPVAISVPADMPGRDTQRRLQPRPRSMRSLLLDVMWKWATRVLAAVVGVLGSGADSFLKLITAHTLLVILFFVSAMLNSFYTSRDSWQWWHERNAAKFMARVGVHPNNVMSRGIWLQDINNLTTYSPDSHPLIMQSLPEHSAPGQNHCLQTFHQLVTHTSPDAPADFAGLPSSSMSTASTARRLRRTRQNMAAYRHDLMVAMRVVNRVEEDVLKAEWENWVLDEVVRCRRVQELLRNQRVNDTALEDWLKGYCGDCRRSLEAQ